MMLAKQSHRCDPKIDSNMMAHMLEMRGEMMKAMGEIMLKHGKMMRGGATTSGAAIRST